ncbi:DUF6412 domain-containing protein [Planotetraspora sp. GP83]|uniref:DUF6412 domain-containing protein n=1 Tax=Planotetraspora sp. GP83 TaxID=3156264 RepID=UPI003511DF6A
MTSLQAATRSLAGSGMGSGVGSLAGFLAGLFAGVLAGSPGLGLVTALGLAGVTVLVFAWIVGRLAGVTAPEPSPGWRFQHGRMLFVRFRDPGTAGRPRPRAPSASPALA